MNTPKHTPGPWHVGLKPGPMVYGPQGEQIVGLNVMLESDEVLANAKFIAAAPAMYEAGTLSLDVMERVAVALERMGNEGLRSIVRSAIIEQKAALAQAEGCKI